MALLLYSLTAMLLSTLVLPAASSAATPSTRVTGACARPVVAGAAGPHRRVTVTLSCVTRPYDVSDGFSATLELPNGKRLPLAGPDEPADFFLIEPQAVFFAPINRSNVVGIVILYNSSQIGPQHDLDHRALVYRVTVAGAERMPALEERLEGVRTAAAARARLAGRR